MEIKIELFNNYKKAVKKSSNTFHNDEEYNDHDYTDNTESQSTVVEVKTKII